MMFFLSYTKAGKKKSSLHLTCPIYRDKRNLVVQSADLLCVDRSLLGCIGAFGKNPGGTG